MTRFTSGHQTPMDERAPRYVPVRYRGRSRMLFRAAVEDRSDEVVIPVVNASVAVTLADLLNREERGEPLPDAAPAPPLSPFAAVNPDGGVGPPFFVVWATGAARRFMAVTRERADAEHLASLLNHVGYHVHTSAMRTWFGWPAVANDRGDLRRLADPTLPPNQRRRPPSQSSPGL
jgi:hypothetical protein